MQCAAYHASKKLPLSENALSCGEKARLEEVQVATRDASITQIIA